MLFSAAAERTVEHHALKPSSLTCYSVSLDKVGIAGHSSCWVTLCAADTLRPALLGEVGLVRRSGLQVSVYGALENLGVRIH